MLTLADAHEEIVWFDVSMDEVLGVEELDAAGEGRARTARASGRRA